MAAYIITDIKVSDQARYAQYRALSPGAVSAAGGEFLVRGGRHRTMEGEWIPDRVVMLRFPTYEQACAFYDSELYQAARAKRVGATERFNMIVVEGV
ncbi:MAG TPA: DUF1330 domain-containing protein [Burkholderiaceae bacterium]|nr:DUF1330 domain-containing protein [Burkholderiaceae bacterium]